MSTLIPLLLLACNGKTPGGADSAGHGDTGVPADTASPADTAGRADTGSPDDTDACQDTGEGDTGKPQVTTVTRLEGASWTWTGEHADQLGYSVAFAGDTNGDGQQEMLASAPDQGAGPVLGTDEHFELVTIGVDGAPALLATMHFRTQGQAGTNFGVAAGGDLNGDGYDDVAVGDYSSILNPDANLSGAVAVYLGPVSGDLDEYDADYTLTGSADNEHLGYQVAFVPNPDDPRRVSLIAVAPTAPEGAAYLWRDLAASGTDDTADARFYGFSWAGWAANSAGDIDGDGVNDLLMSALGSVGRVFVVSGPFAPDIDLETSEPALVGEDTSTETGSDVAGVGDLNGDGYDDILIGDPFDEEVGGKAWLVYGPVRTSQSLADAPARLVPVSTDGYFGYSVAGLGDVNGDGSLDIGVGAPRDEDLVMNRPGSVYLFSAPVCGTISAADADLVIVGRETGDWAGAFMDGGRDIDGDGRPDLLVASPFGSEGAPSGGEVDLLTGLSW